MYNLFSILSEATVTIFALYASVCIYNYEVATGKAEDEAAKIAPAQKLADRLVKPFDVFKSVGKSIKYYLDNTL